MHMEPAQRHRAIDEDEKDERRLQILLAAESLIENNHNRLPSVAEVAAEAGLAKGTVYLYFQSKDELLLSLHGLHSARFFSAMETLLDGPVADLESVLEVTRRCILEVPTFMPLAGNCLGSAQGGMKDELLRDLHETIDQRLMDVGYKLERHFPTLSEGEGANLLIQGYGLMIGLWQLMQPELLDTSTEKILKKTFHQRNYIEETDSGLRALWAGHMNRNNKQDSEHE